MAKTDPRLKMLKQRHVKPLMEVIRAIRSRRLSVPNVDPNDGGSGAVALFLLESPGPKAVGSQFISRCNPDQSARNMGSTLEQAGLKRRETVLWNVVPYCISTASKNGKPTRKQVSASVTDTLAFINALPNLRVICFCGGDAKYQRSKISKRLLAGFAVLETFHPAARSFRNNRQRAHIQRTFRKVRDLLDEAVGTVAPPKPKSAKGKK